MPWLRFLSDYDFKPRPAVTIAYRAGDIRNVTRACASRAIAAGKAETTERPGNDGRQNARQAGVSAQD